jgi:hypothetical protein
MESDERFISFETRSGDRNYLSILWNQLLIRKPHHLLPLFTSITLLSSHNLLSLWGNSLFISDIGYLSYPHGSVIAELSCLSLLSLTFLLSPPFP